MDKRRVNVRGIIWHESKLLAVRHKKANGEADYWCVPGGGLDPKESLVDGLIRELYEETGIKAQIGQLLCIQQLNSTRAHRDEELELFFNILNPGDFTKIDLDQTSHGGQEIARCEFIDPTKEYILPRFLSTINLPEYIAGSQPVYIYNEL